MEVTLNSMQTASIQFGTGLTTMMPGSVEDPDGNGWLLQEITKRLPGATWQR